MTFVILGKMKFEVSRHDTWTWSVFVHIHPMLPSTMNIDSIMMGALYPPVPWKKPSSAPSTQDEDMVQTSLHTIGCTLSDSLS